MDPITLAMIGAPIVTDLLSQFLSKGDRDAEKRLQEEALAIYGDASPPTLERMLQERLGPSAMEAIPQDFGNRNARNSALQQMVDMGSQGGMDAGSQLAVEEARRAAAAQETQGRGAVRQEFQRRGLGGAGEATMALQAQQAGADRAGLADMQAAGDARSRALQALAAGGGMAAQAEGQDFDRAARIAQSKDAIARFNSELSTNAIQQNFQNDMALRGAKYGALTNAAGQRGDAARNTQQRVGNYGQAVQGGLGVFGQPGGPAATQHGTLQAAEPMDYDPADPRYRKPR